MSMTRTLLSLLLLLGGLIASTPASSKEVIFELEDPRGDDHGAGSLEYPLRTEFQKGDLDLIELRALRVSGGTRFEARFDRPIRKAGREAIDDLGTQLDTVARYGFYTFNLDVYIDQDREPGSGSRAMMPGRKAEVDPAHAWERAVILTPMPNEARGMLTRIITRKAMSARSETGEDPVRRDLKAEVGVGLQDRVYFPNQIRVRGKEVSFFVPDTFLREPASAEWSYTVVVSGASLLQSFDLSASANLADETRDSLMILPISPGSWKDRFGGGRDNQELEPPLVDYLAPPGQLQEKLLRDYDSQGNRPARLLGVVPAEVENP